MQGLLGGAPENAFIDVDGDGDKDFDFSHGIATTGQVIYLAFVSPYNNKSDAQVLITGTPLAIPVASALSGNYTISSAPAGRRIWNTNSKGQNLLSANKYGSDFGYFQGPGDEYIGVRFINSVSGGGDGQLHYGWIQVNVPTGVTSLTIVDWAWEDTPNAPILAEARTGGAPPAVIPTLNEWGLIVLMTLLAGAAAWKMNRPEPLQT